MGFMFLDIETYSSKSNPGSSLNPYEQESKILVISYNYYEGFKPPRKENFKEPIFLKVWDSDEKEMLSGFYDLIKEIQRKDNYMKFVGFNILKFDLPYLFGRMKLLGIANEKELYQMFFNKFNLDMYQLSSLISKETSKYEQLWPVNHKKTSEFLKLQIKEGEGIYCSEFYDKKEFDKILDYCSSEFNLEQMFDSLYIHVLNLRTPKSPHQKL